MLSFLSKYYMYHPFLFCYVNLSSLLILYNAQLLTVSYVYLELQSLPSSDATSSSPIVYPPTSTFPFFIRFSFFIILAYHTIRFSSFSGCRTLPFDIGRVGRVVNSVFSQGIFEFLKSINEPMKHDQAHFQIIISPKNVVITE